MRNMFHACIAGFVLSTCALITQTHGADAPATTQPADEQAALEEQFAKTMTNAELVGHFTIEGNDRPPGTEHYTISSARKLKGDLWLLTSRIQFGDRDVTVPLILPIKWAGDTPIITVTKMGIPGIGTYTARVLIYDDHYAGTWSGSAAHRGSLFGKIEHPATTQPAQ